jgi:hypothetical protein
MTYGYENIAFRALKKDMVINPLGERQHFSFPGDLECKEKCLLLQPGKSYTACSLGTPPGLDRSKGTWL